MDGRVIGVTGGRGLLMLLVRLIVAIAGHRYQRSRQRFHHDHGSIAGDRRRDDRRGVVDHRARTTRQYLTCYPIYRDGLIAMPNNNGYSLDDVIINPTYRQH